MVKIICQDKKAHRYIFRTFNHKDWIPKGFLVNSLLIRERGQQKVTAHKLIEIYDLFNDGILILVSISINNYKENLLFH